MSDDKNIAARLTDSFYVPAAALLLLALALRLFRINQGLWYDELHNYLRFVVAPWRVIATSVPVPNNHILYTLLAKLCENWFGRSEWSLRLPAMIAGAVTPALAFIFLRRRVGGFSAFLAGLLMALNFWMVCFSQDARGYSAFILLSMLGNIFYLEWLDNKKVSYAAGYFLVSVVGAYFYFYNGFIISSQVVLGFFLWMRQREKIKPRVFILPVAALLVSALLYAPAAWEMFRYVDYVHGRVKDIGVRAFTPFFFKQLLVTLSGARQIAFAGLCLVLSLAGVARLFRKWPGICLLYLMAAAFMIAFTLVMRVFIMPRFLSFLIPFFALGLAEGLAALDDLLKNKIVSLKPDMARIIFSLALCAVLVFGLVKYYQLGKQGYKDAVNYVEKNYPGKNIVSFGLSSQELLYYDPTANAWPNKKALEPVDLTGNLVIASFPWSWPKQNIDLIRQSCSLEKVWTSMSDEGNEVYLYKCF
jgi:mannosyltransferase